MGDVIPIETGQETPEQAAAEREAGPLPDDVEPCSDLANAYRLAELHGGDLLFARSLGWLAWDGQRYAPDELGLPARCAQDVARAIRTESASLKKRAARATTDATRDRLNKRSERLWGWAGASQQDRGLRCMLKVAESLETFAVLPSVFDTDPMVLNAQNGTVDLKTGKLREHDRGDRITKVAGAQLLDDFGCPRWLSFLGRIFDGNEELIGFLQRAVGYSLTGSTGEQCFFLLWGQTGSNGKSTLLEVLRYVAGDYACNSSPDVLMSQRGGRGPENDVARLRSARLVTASESGETRRLDEERVKRLTGGDTYTARFLHKEYFEFQPQFKLWLAANNKPEIRGTDNAIWRRVRLIPFEVTIPPEEQDPGLPAKLQGEAPGILRWAVEGCLGWQGRGLDPPLEVVDATADYRSEQDAIGRFIDEECTVMEQLRVKVGVLYDRYVRWCQRSGEAPITKRAMGLRLKDDERFQPDKASGARWWVGLGVNAEEDREQDV
jgi:putative DNA primase/helicase